MSRKKARMGSGQQRRCPACAQRLGWGHTGGPRKTYFAPEWHEDRWWHRRCWAARRRVEKEVLR